AISSDGRGIQMHSPSAGVRRPRERGTRTMREVVITGKPERDSPSIKTGQAHTAYRDSPVSHLTRGVTGGNLTPRPPAEPGANVSVYRAPITPPLAWRRPDHRLLPLSRLTANRA